MSEIKDLKDELTTNINDDRIKKERSKLFKQFNKIEKKKLKIVEKLIDNAAFMAVMLEDIQQRINENGYMIEYKNGENQYGTKKNPEIEIYNQTISNYSKTIKQLSDLLPVEIKLEQKDTEKDKILDFIKGKK